MLTKQSRATKQNFLREPEPEDDISRLYTNQIIRGVGEDKSKPNRVDNKLRAFNSVTRHLERSSW